MTALLRRLNTNVLQLHGRLRLAAFLGLQAEGNFSRAARWPGRVVLFVDAWRH